MAQSPPSQGLPGLDPWVFSQGWGSDSTSPASSSDSSGSCPCYITRRPSQPEGLARSASKAQAAPTVPRRARPAPAGGQRQSASEREKLRMRTLARALHELRRFLPPSVAPAGQSLTKIETLRLAIRYIGHLSAVLGLSEDSLRRRRQRSADTASSHRCPLCPDGGGRPQAQTLGTGLGSAISSGVSWGSPSVCPGPRISPENLGISNVDPWVTPPYCPQIQSPLNQSLGRALDTPHWIPPQAYSGTQTSPEPRNKTGLWSPSTAPAELTEVYQVSGYPMKGRMEGAFPTAVGEKTRPWKVKATATVAIAAIQQSPQPGEERMALGFTQRPGWKSLSVSPEPCLSLESPPLLHRPSCQRLQPQPQWGCWGHNAEVLSSSKDQGSSPASQLPVASPIPTSGLQLSGCPELWQEDLEGPPLNIFY